MIKNKDAWLYAGELVDALASHCARIEIAGSLRRGDQRYVRDLDLVCAPKFFTASGKIPGVKQVSTVDCRIDDLLRASAPTKLHRLTRPHGGKAADKPYWKRLIYRGLIVDLIIVLPPAQWGVILALRTGPREVSKLLMTPEARGGCLPVDHRVRAGAVVVNGREIPTPEERDFFRTIELPYVPPEKRTVEELKRLVRERQSF